MPRPRSDIRARIIAAARTRFVADGVDGSSLRRIAKDAGTNIGMVYYYFETKDALFLEVIEDRYAGVLADLEEIFARELPFLDRVELASARMGALSEDEFDVVRIVIGELLRSPADRKQLVLDRFKAGHLGLVLRAGSEAASSGQIDDRHPVPMMLLATFGGAVLPQLVARVIGEALPLQVPAPGELARTLADIVRHGVEVREQ